MTEPFSMSDLEGVSVTLEEADVRPREREAPFRVALLGDWGGRKSTYTPVRIDRDNFDDALARLGVSAELRFGPAAGGASMTLRFESIEDFHPGRIYERAEAFETLRELRRRLESHSTYDAAAEEVRRRFGLQNPDDDAAETAQRSDEPSGESGTGGLLDQILEGGAGQKPLARPATADDELSALVREAVRPHLAATDAAQQEDLIALVDGATTSLMRSVLSNPRFKALEAAWRGAHFLALRLETGTDLKLYLVDVPKEKLSADLASSEDLRATSLYELLNEHETGGLPWSLVAADYTFEPTREDVLTLIRLAKIAARAGAAFIAAAGPRAIGCESLAEMPDPEDWRDDSGSEGERAWALMRALPEASYVGLALPRFLLRLPYGAETEPVEAFDFEETDTSPAHEDYLWGNPAFACAYLLAEAFSRHGWEMRPGAVQEIDGLPLHIYEGHDGTEIKPCAETLLTARAAEAILERGVMPLLSLKGHDTIRLARFQSLADPPTSLAGPWD